MPNARPWMAGPDDPKPECDAMDGSGIVLEVRSKALSAQKMPNARPWMAGPDDPKPECDAMDGSRIVFETRNKALSAQKSRTPG
jgi:hypothetical protein